MISTRLTQFFDIEHPIILAPMTPAAGADLSSAVAAAGGLGLLGGGYGDRSWFEAESAKITRNDVGCGFITWSVAQQPDLLDLAIERHPRAIMLSFADPAPFAPRIKQARVPLICQGPYGRPGPTSSRCRGRCRRCPRHGSGRPRPNCPINVAVRADGGGRFEQTCP
jgi:NAD(P)H-dependent flavin oxidoreductase YrpB (nitropropane dioxygenase family)